MRALRSSRKESARPSTRAICTRPAATIVWVGTNNYTNAARPNRHSCQRGQNAAGAMACMRGADLTRVSAEDRLPAGATCHFVRARRVGRAGPSTLWCDAHHAQARPPDFTFPGRRRWCRPARSRRTCAPRLWLSRPGGRAGASSRPCARCTGKTGACPGRGRRSPPPSRWAPGRGDGVGPLE
jgi:hypothetical protein